MCWIMVKAKGNKLREDYMDKAQEHNSDGYGVAWIEDKNVQTFKTLNYDLFKAKLKELGDKKGLVIHLRNTTAGDTKLENCHPFTIRNGGVMFHNGTIYDLKKEAKAGESDSMALRDLINSCKFSHISNITPLLKTIIGDRINRLVFLERTGKVTIVNPELGMWEDGNWYSNDYHKKEDTWTRKGKYTYNKYSNTYEEEDEEDDVYAEYSYLSSTEPDYIPAVTKVFVYGTLKEGYSNHNYWMKGTSFYAEGETVDKWTMVGKGMSYPYLLEENDSYGANIKGEVYTVTREQLLNLDTLEGCPYHYRRKVINIKVDEGNVVQAYVYYKNSITYEDLSKEFIDEWTKD